MSYLGIGPASFTNNLTNVQILDDIKSQFNGTEDDFQLTSNDIPFQAVSDRALMVILGGVIQAPGVDYTINGTQITFTTPPVSGLTFYARNIYGLNALNGVNDGIVGPYSLTTGAPTWDTSGNTTISGNLTVQGATTTISSTTLDVIDKDIKIASNQSTNAGIDTAGLLWGTTAVKLKFYNNGGTNPGLNIEGTNVGINTTAPTEKLHVTGNIKASGTVTATTFSGTLSGGLPITNGADNRVITASSATAIQGEANLTFDGAKLTVTSASKDLLYLNSTHSDGLQVPLQSNGTDFAYFGSAKTLFSGGSVTDLGFRVATNICFGIGASEKVRIDSSGRVRIANTTFGASGDADTLIVGTTSGTRGISIISGNNNTGSLIFGDTNDNDVGGVIYNHNGDTLDFRANGQTRATVSSTAFWVDDGTNARLKLAPDGATLNMIISTTTNNGSYCNLLYGAAEHIFKYGGTETARLTTTGNYTITGEFASAQDYPTVRPTLDLNFVATNKLDSRVKFFRNSHATYIDKDGIVRIVGDNTPRFDYDPETKECLGLLMEGESSSRLTQSSHITAGVGAYHQIITDNYYKGPDDIEGSAREYIHRGDSGSATGGSTSIWANQPIGIANPVSVSYFVKITRGSSMGFEMIDNNNNLNSHRVDISGGYISDGSYATVSTNNPGNAEGTTSYQRFPNGWVKVKWENISKSGGNATTYLQMYLQNHATSTAANPVGYAVWGFQVENEAFCTSTIIKNKTDVAKDRGREVAIIEKEDFADFWNPLEGTAYVDALMPHSYSNSGIPAFSIKHTVNTSHSLGFFRDNGSSPVWHFFNDGAGITARTAGASDFRYRSALAFKEADINGAINGVASMNQTSAFTMQKFDYMYLGSLNSADNDLHGHLKRFTYYPKKLSDNQLLNITS